ncbi:MAG: COX15/CtaA family protein, partial [Caldilineaceae bacterium]|nr:COX15/CtaA family protein [Caldilineaceae bacterium]
LWSLVVAVVGMFVLGASGGITALGDTLVLGAGISPEESPVVATLVELRIFHPIIAFAVGGLVFLAALLARSRRADMTTQRLALVVMSLYVTQLVLGALNVALMAPVWLQMVHLLFTTSIWISLILLAASTLAVGEESRAADMGMQPARPGATA